MHNETWCLAVDLGQPDAVVIDSGARQRARVSCAMRMVPLRTAMETIAETKIETCLLLSEASPLQRGDPRGW